MKSVLLGFAAASALALSAVATTLPASAAPAAPLKVSSSTLTTQRSGTPVGIAIPGDVGKIVCSGDVCIQRTTPIVNNEANVKAWADTAAFYGHFELQGPDGHIANRPVNGDKWWYAGGAGVFFNVAKGGGYTIIGWTPNPWRSVGTVNFSV